MTDGVARFSAVDVITIASRLSIEDKAFVIGGQATNLWAWFYQDRADELSSDLDFTSKDIDYFGGKDAAESLAEALGGKVYYPKATDMNSPNTAIVVAELNGKKLEVDFMHGVLGISRREIEKGVSVLRLEAELDGNSIEADVAVLHPVLCMKSRIANMLSPATMRRDQIAWRQLHASMAVVKVYLEDVLKDQDVGEANACFKDINNFILTDQFGRRASAELDIDLVCLLEDFVADERLDSRYRERTLRTMVERLKDFLKRREIRGLGG